MKILILVLCFLSATLTLRIEHKKASHKSSYLESYLVPELLKSQNKPGYIPPNQPVRGQYITPSQPYSGYQSACPNIPPNTDNVEVNCMGVRFVYMGPMYIKCGIPLVRVTKQTYCRTTTECASVFKDYKDHCHSPNKLFT